MALKLFLTTLLFWTPVVDSAAIPVQECSFVAQEDGTYRIHWSDSPTVGADTIIRRRPASASQFHWRARVSEDGFIDGPTPVPGESVRYQVSSRVGQEQASPYTECTDFPTPIDPSTMSFSQRTSDNAVKIKFTKSPVANGYNLHRNNPDGSETFLGWYSANDFGATVTLVDTSTNLVDGNAYRYTVQTTAAGDIRSAKVDTNAAFTYQDLNQDVTKPVKAKKPIFDSATDSSITIKLKDLGDNVGVTHFLLFRGTSTKFKQSTEIATVPRTGTKSTYVDKGLESATTYYYWSKAVDAAGNKSKKSGRRTAKTDDPPTPTTNEKYQTTLINGRWELVETANPGVPARWEATNVRGDRLGSQPLDQTDMNKIAERFNTIRLAVHWDDIAPSENTNIAQSLDNEVLDAIIKANQAGLSVILDPIHLGGGTGFWIPGWAWSVANQPSLDPDNSFEVISYRPVNGGPTLGGIYLSAVLNWVKGHEEAGTFDNVVALELVNEPHPPDGFAWDYTHLIAALQREWVEDLRQIDADKPFILTGYFGGFLANQAQVVAEFVSDGSPRFSNLIWTFHNYYTGRPGGEAWDKDGDGFGDFDATPSYRIGAKTGVRAESFAGAGCYGGTTLSPSGSEFSCPAPTDAERSVLRGHLVDSITRQDDLAQAAGMPLFVGEWGVTTYRLYQSRWVGWGYSQNLICDHLIAMRSLGHPGNDAITNPGLSYNFVSYAVWNLDRRGDAYGVYDGGSNQWFDDTSGDPEPGQAQNLEGQGVAQPFVTPFCTGT